jgi:hypothetical protein
MVNKEDACLIINASVLASDNPAVEVRSDSSFR